MSEALLDIKLLTMNDFGKIARHQTLHLAFQALHGFVKKEQRLPRPRYQVSEGSRMLQPTLIHFKKQVVRSEKKTTFPLSYSQTQIPCSTWCESWMQWHRWRSWMKLLSEACPSQLEVTWLLLMLSSEASPLKKLSRWGVDACNTRLHPSFSLYNTAVVTLCVSIIHSLALTAWWSWWYSWLFSALCTLWCFCRHVAGNSRLFDSGYISMRWSASLKRGTNWRRATFHQYVDRLLGLKAHH